MILRFACLASVLIIPNFGLGQSTPLSANGSDRVSDVRSSTVDLQVIARSVALIPGNPPVIEELGVLDYQIEQLESIQREFREQLSLIRDKASSTTGAERKRAAEKVYRDAQASLNDVLLPRQQSRLRQIALQSLVVSNNEGFVNVPKLIRNGTIRRHLSISPESERKLRTKLTEERKRVAEEIRKLRAESQRRLMEVFSERERKQLEEIVGEPFDFQGYAPARGGSFRKGDEDKDDR